MPHVKVYGKSFKVNEVYQPVYGQAGTGKRGCDDRLRTLYMSDAMFNNNRLLGGTVADIGCNLGYFLFKLSERNEYKLTGIDKNAQVVAIADHIKRHKSINNVTFQTATASGDGFPVADTYLVFSVLHHVMKGPKFADDVFLVQAAKHASTIYVELATHLEWPGWAKKLVVPGNPYAHWERELSRITGNNFNVRLIGMHPTHINTVRPMYQLKRKLAESLSVDGKTYTVYDRWTTAYRGYKACELSAQEIGAGKAPRSSSEYMFATCDNEHWFIKRRRGKYAIKRKVRGMLLSDILKYALLNFYDVVKLEHQLLDYASGARVHPDLNPWNFIVTESSDLVPIDEEGASLFGRGAEASKKLSWGLMNLIY
jgi:SAM-dependent methyltransferase